MTTIPVVRFVFGGRESAGTGMGRPYTVVYDGTCKVCGRLVGMLHTWDTRRAIETIPSQSGDVPSRFPWIPADAYVQAVQLIGPGGITWSGAAAIEQLLDILPRGGLIGWIFKLPFAGALADKFYKWFARNRYSFGCGEHCALHAQALAFDDPPSESTR